LSYIQQNIFLLDNTIKHNITLSLEDQIDYHSFNKIIDSLQLDKFFKNLPDQLNTKVGVNGISLSGGQKQIISLARALYKNSEILILDEATSALDVNMIAIVKKLLLSLKGKKTIIMVTHDLNYFSGCFDKVIEIKSGTLNILKS
jgi:ATPase subunit of ABC transporter with duplicated ATPase domains